MGSQCIKKLSQDLTCQLERLFPTQFPCQLPTILIKILWLRFQQCLGTFTMLLVEASSEMGLFRLKTSYLKTFSEYVTSKMKIVWGSSLFSKCSEFNLDSKNAGETSGMFFCFWDKCLWIGIFKLSPLRTGYFSSAANVSRSSAKIFHVNKRNFFQLNWFCSGQWSQ